MNLFKLAKNWLLRAGKGTPTPTPNDPAIDAGFYRLASNWLPLGSLDPRPVGLLIQAKHIIFSPAVVTLTFPPLLQIPVPSELRKVSITFKREEYNTYNNILKGSTRA